MIQINENFVKFEDKTTLTLDDVSDLAAAIINQQAKKTRMLANDPSVVKKIFTSLIGYTQEESFWVMYMAQDLRIIETKKLFSGSVASSEVHPRVVIRRALEVGASAIICAHNHPAGSTEPSVPDKASLKILKKACDIFDIRVVDNIIVAGDEVVSFAQLGLM